jgi:tRNA dimethylallyltransferase
MFEQGFLDEVQSILDRGYTLNDPGLNTVGYKEAIAFLNDEISREQMIKDMKTQTRRYAKRQLSWFRRWDFIKWIDLEEIPKNKVVNFIEQQLAAKLNKD